MGNIHGYFTSRGQELDHEIDSVMEEWENLAERKSFLHPKEYDALMKEIGDRSQRILDNVRGMRL